MGLGPVRLLAGTMMLTSASPSLAAYVIPQVQPAVFNFTVGSNANIQDGNARFYSATSPDIGAVNVRVTGWSLEKVKTGKNSYTTYVRDSKLMVYDGGLGVISGDDDGGGSNQHTADNEGRKDFILFQFDRKVKFVGATFNTYSVLGQTKDSDATFKYGHSDGLYSSFMNLDGKTEGYLNGLFDGTFESTGGSSGGSRWLNPDRKSGNLWLIGASFVNADGKIDGFKLANLAVVPEPGTWMMMIGGFGLLGAAVRRQRRTALAAA
jgi:hypothetical protein